MINKDIHIAQKTSLKLLKIFIGICEKNGLRYYVGGGTMLGAVRHKGFIPWDDDADIDMPREDYQRFLKICKDELKEYPECDVKSLYTDNSPLLIARLVDNSIKIKKSEGFITDYITPLWLDIVPVDGMQTGDASSDEHILFIEKGLSTAFSNLKILLVGIGYGASYTILGQGYYSNFHNAFVSFLVECGLFALIFFVLLLLCPLKNNKSNFPIIAVLILANIPYQIYIEPYFWFFIPFLCIAPKLQNTALNPKKAEGEK